MATNPYVNKVVYGNDTVMDISDTDATTDDVLNGKKFYLGSGAPAVGTAIGGIPEEELRDTVGWTGKNLLVYPYKETTKTANGITFTDNGDGSITINGTATADAPFALQGEWGTTNLILPAGNYKFTLGANIQGLKYFTIYNTTTLSTDVEDVVAPNGITYVLLRVVSGTTINNVTIYPMLRHASISDSTYEPYHASVKDEAYCVGDATETDIADGDYFPFFDTSDGKKKRSLWSNLIAKIKAKLATVASTGAYSDLTGKPTIPTVNNGTLTIQRNGTTVKTFTANSSSNVTANITVPTYSDIHDNFQTNGYVISYKSITSSTAPNAFPDGITLSTTNFPFTYSTVVTFNPNASTRTVQLGFDVGTNSAIKKRISTSATAWSAWV